MEPQWDEYCYRMDSNDQQDTLRTDLDYKTHSVVHTSLAGMEGMWH